MIKVYTGFKGIALPLLILAGTVIFISFFFWGITKVIQFFLPLLIVASYLLIIIFVLGFLPATYFKDLRPSLCVNSVLMSHALSVSAWLLSFFYVMNAFGFWGIFFAFLFQFLSPIALVGALLKGSWHIAEHLTVWIFFVYAMRFYSQWLLSLSPRNRRKGDVIDVDVIEGENQD